MLKHRFSQSERRKYPRIQKRISLKVKADSFDLTAETHNISLSGIYCQVDKNIELMTKVGVMLLLPFTHTNGKTITKQVHCKGVVVRAEEAKESNGKFDIAVFFNDMKKTEENAIRQYMASHMPQV